MADFKSAGSCIRQTAAVEMNVNANGWLSPDILQTSTVTPETGSLPTTFIFHDSLLLPLQVFSSSCSNSCWNGHCLSPVMLFHICRLPWHLVSERIRKKIIFHSLKCFIHLSHKTLRLRQSCVSAIKAKCCMNNRHDLLYTRTALALNYLLQGQIPAGLHLFMISVSFFPMLIFYFLFFKPYLEDKRKAHAANIYFIAMMISCNISQSDSQHNIQVTALECGYDWVCLLHSDSR